MLATASLKKSFWAEAVNTACYVINQSPSTAVDLKTPIEMWTGKLVNYSDLHIFGSLVYEGEPSTLQEALNNPYASFWKEAMQKEIEALHKNKTWELVHTTRGVVKGYAQKEGINFNKKNSPMVRMTTIRVVLAMCDIYDLHLEQLDVKTVFLHGNLEEEIYMLQPEGFEQKGKELGCQSPNKDASIDRRLTDREFEMKDLGLANKIIEMQIHRDRVSRKYWLSQKSYVKKILQRPDIAHAVGVVSRYMVEPGREHWEAVKRILRYIKGTSYVALFIVVIVTTEACMVERMLLEELEHEQEKITLFCDYQSALYLARNPTFHSKTKHIRVQYHFVHEKVEEGTVDMQKIHTDDNVADYLTKAIMTSLYGVDPHAA
ncbi:retrovirus-related pol polyprotein from transposon TNT 1-94 [Tanacetum coccineum]|uniref:Retrovirus-related pol polyprotein from transposon TNT 1-94 n=1 Tax=Tanacetum coccineum TaxID=301880 RepID=A0ABQ5HWE8_9ASTR